MSGNFGIRTDLAVESKEKYEKNNVEIKGVAIQEKYEEALDLNTTVVRIQTEQGAKAMEKPKGTYITMEAPNLIVPDEDYHRGISQVLAHHLKELLHLEKEKSILVVGLGNREITPDALGPQVIQNLKITRHIIKEYGKAGMGKRKAHQISSLVPGVMAQTGMETMEIIRGVIRETDPDAVIAIDALAARSVRRLNCTIQITDTGINPGSGVGNHRNAITEKTVGIPVIAIGVPTVVDAATIVGDTMDNLLSAVEVSESLKGMANVIKGYSPAEKYELIKELIAPHLNGMFVTPKDIDETVRRISYTISEALNMLFAASAT